MANNNTDRSVKVKFDGSAAGLARAARQAQRELEQAKKKMDDYAAGIRKASVIGTAGIAGMFGASVAGAAGISGSLALLPVAFAAVGVSALRANKEIDKSFEEMGNSIQTTIAKAAQPLVGTFQNITKSVNASLSNMDLETIFKAIGPQLETLTNGFLKLVENALPGFTTAIQNAGPIIDSISRGMGLIGESLSYFFTTISGESGNAAIGLDMVFKAIDWLIRAAADLIAWLTSLIPWFIQWKDQLYFVASALGAAYLAAKTFSTAKAFIEGVTTAFNVMKLAMAANPWLLLAAAVVGIAFLIYTHWDQIKGYLGAAWEWIKSTAAAAWNWVKDSVGQAIEGIKGFVNGMIDRVKAIPGQIRDAVGNLGSLLVNAGRDLLTGLWNGITGAASWLKSKIAGFFGSLLPGWAKDFLGIHSPSKVFRDQIGKWIPEGMAEGILGNIDSVRNAVGTVSNAALSPLGSSAPRVSVAAPNTSVTVMIDGQEFRGMIQNQIDTNSRATRRTVGMGRSF